MGRKDLSFEQKRELIENSNFYWKIYWYSYPYVRKARVKVTVKEKKRSKEELKDLTQSISTGPLRLDLLSRAELLYGISIQDDIGIQKKMYYEYNQKYDNSTSNNNLGALYLKIALNELEDSSKKQLYIDSADFYLTKSIEKHKKPINHHNKAILNLIKGNPSEALNHSKKSLELYNGIESNKSVYNETLASTYYLLGDYRNAARFFKKVNQSANISFNIGLCYLFLNNFENAEDFFTEASKQNEQWVLPYYGLTILYARLNNYEELDGLILKIFEKDKELHSRLKQDVELSDYWEYKKQQNVN